MTRSMADPEMMAMVAHALLERGRDRDAMDVVWDIPDPRVMGQMLYLGEWQDRTHAQELIEDITQANPRTTQKYDPKLRVGVTEGLQALFTARQQEALVAQNTAAAAEWAQQADVMYRRAELLRRQITIGYIKAPRKK